MCVCRRWGGGRKRGCVNKARKGIIIDCWLTGTIGDNFAERSLGDALLEDAHAHLVRPRFLRFCGERWNRDSAPIDNPIMNRLLTIVSVGDSSRDSMWSTCDMLWIYWRVNPSLPPVLSSLLHLFPVNRLSGQVSIINNSLERQSGGWGRLRGAPRASFVCDEPVTVLGLFIMNQKLTNRTATIHHPPAPAAVATLWLSSHWRFLVALYPAPIGPVGPVGPVSAAPSTRPSASTSAVISFTRCPNQSNPSHPIPPSAPSLILNPMTH